MLTSSYTSTSSLKNSLFKHNLTAIELHNACTPLSVLAPLLQPNLDKSVELPSTINCYQ